MVLLFKMENMNYLVKLCLHNSIKSFVCRPFFSFFFCFFDVHWKFFIVRWKCNALKDYHKETKNTRRTKFFTFRVNQVLKWKGIDQKKNS